MCLCDVSVRCVSVMFLLCICKMCMCGFLSVRYVCDDDIVVVCKIKYDTSNGKRQTRTRSN